MEEHLWNVVRADVHMDYPVRVEWYFVRDHDGRVIAGPLRKDKAAEIAAAHNSVVEALANPPAL